MCGMDETYPICAKVADFGLSIRTGSSVKKREVHNACWLAPEIMYVFLISFSYLVLFLYFIPICYTCITFFFQEGATVYGESRRV